MDDLDFSGLTDDQLIGLAKGCCIEALQRSPAATDAMLEMMRSEAAKAALKNGVLENRDASLLKQAAALVGYGASEISLLYTFNRNSKRVFINTGPYRFSRSHLVEYDTATAIISTVAALDDRKLELIEFCAALSAVVPLDTHITL